MQIEINVPRPLLTLVTIGGFIGVFMWLQGDPRLNASARQKLLNAQLTEGTSSVRIVDGDPHGLPVGGDDTTPSSVKITNLEENIRNTRTMQALLSRKEELLRYEVTVLQAERAQYGANVPPSVEDQFRQSATQLSELIKDQKKAEDSLRDYFSQLWEADGRADAIARSYTGIPAERIALQWPVQPALGISAFFHDAAYFALFGFRHNAIDVPTPQGTPVVAAADGVVKDVVDNGLGFNYVTIDHGGGIVTLYGHLSVLSVQPGQTLVAGQQIGKSGGRPGTPGAGFSTGPHLHFGVRLKGDAVDPLNYLPAMPTVQRPTQDATSTNQQ